MPPEEFRCMNCGAPNLYYLHCKIRCENCGFLLDCSDLDVGGELQRAGTSQKSHEALTPESPQASDNLT
jgi:hypothetical protein